MFFRLACYESDKGNMKTAGNDAGKIIYYLFSDLKRWAYWKINIISHINKFILS